MRTGGMICSFFPLVFVRVLMGIVSRAAVVAPDREREREERKNGEREKNVSAPNGPAPENRYGRTDERGMSGGRREGS